MNVFDKDGNAVGTKAYLADLDRDQLHFCIEHANELLEKKRIKADEGVVTWSVNSDNLRVKFNIGHQYFTLDYEDGEEQNAWMAGQLRKALSRLAA